MTQDAIPQADPVIETQVWTPDPDRPGYLKHTSTRTVREVADQIRAIVGESPEGCNEYFSARFGPDPDRLWPEGRTIAYPVTGGSEGWYIHVDVIDPAGAIQNVLLGKTFDGWDAAWAFAKRLAAILAV